MIKKIILSLLTMSCICFFNASLFAGKIDRIIAFGDSLTDNGNIYQFTINAHKLIPLVPIIPKNPPYFEGRFSNGPVWVDDLAQLLQVPLEDYAYGGSWAEPILDSKLNVPFGLQIQVDYYLLKSALDFHKDRHLYVIWTGANDYIQGRDDAEYATTNAVATIKKQLEWLIFYGAKHLYVLNIPDLGLVPLVMDKGPEFAAQVTLLTELHNKKLTIMLNELRANYPDVNLILGNTPRYLQDILTHPKKYKLLNTTSACYNGGYWLNEKFADSKEIMAAKQANLNILSSPDLREAYLASKISSEICSKPNEYLFWDHLHPTERAHAIIAELALKRLQKEGIGTVD